MFVDDDVDKGGRGRGGERKYVTQIYKVIRLTNTSQYVIGRAMPSVSYRAELFTCGTGRIPLSAKLNKNIEDLECHACQSSFVVNISQGAMQLLKQ